MRWCCVFLCWCFLLLCLLSVLLFGFGACCGCWWSAVVFVLCCVVVCVVLFCWFDWLLFDWLLLILVGLRCRYCWCCCCWIRWEPSAKLFSLVCIMLLVLLWFVRERFWHIRCCHTPKLRWVKQRHAVVVVAVVFIVFYIHQQQQWLKSQGSGRKVILV